MLDLLKDIGHFVVAVLTHWQAYITGGIAMAVFWLYERLLNRTISAKTVIIGVIAFLIVAFFMAWRDQRIAVRAAEGKIEELSNPKLRANIDFFVSSEAGPELGIMMVATIYNTGAPTIVEQYRLLVEPQGRPALPIARPSQLTDEQIWKSPEPGGPAFRFLKSDSLIDKTAVNPIIRGGSAKGNILFVVQNSGIITKTTPKIKLTLSFRDINTKEWFTARESTLATPSLQGFPGLQSGPVPAPQ